MVALKMFTEKFKERSSSSGALATQATGNGSARGASSRGATAAAGGSTIFDVPENVFDDPAPAASTSSAPSPDKAIRAWITAEARAKLKRFRDKSQDPYRQRGAGTWIPSLVAPKRPQVPIALRNFSDCPWLPGLPDRV